MKKLLTLGMAAALLVAACAVNAYPTLAGPTGLIQAPTGWPSLLARSISPPTMSAQTDDRTSV